MWNVKAKVIPVIIWGTGTISETLRQYMSNVPGKHEVKELQKTAVLCTAHTTESINLKVQNIFHGLNNITCSTNCKYRTAARPYTLETWCASRI
jgi:UDP-N-acetylglucosamine 2-epimerase